MREVDFRQAFEELPVKLVCIVRTAVAELKIVGDLRQCLQHNGLSRDGLFLCAMVAEVRNFRDAVPKFSDHRLARLDNRGRSACDVTLVQKCDGVDRHNILKNQGASVFTPVLGFRVGDRDAQIGHQSALDEVGDGIGPVELKGQRRVHLLAQAVQVVKQLAFLFDVQAQVNLDRQ